MQMLYLRVLYLSFQTQGNPERRRLEGRVRQIGCLRPVGEVDRTNRDDRRKLLHTSPRGHVQLRTPQGILRKP